MLKEARTTGRRHIEEEEMETYRPRRMDTAAPPSPQLRLLHKPDGGVTTVGKERKGPGRGCEKLPLP